MTYLSKRLLFLGIIAQTYVGCYKDNKPRDLKSAFYYHYTSMTPNNCISYCSSFGYKYAAVQYK